MKQLFSFVVLLALMNGALAMETYRLRLHGSNTIGASLAPELVKLWLAKKQLHIISDKETAKEEREIIAENKQLRLEIEIHAHGSSTSFKDFAIGATDVGMASRPIKDKELKKLAFLGNLKSKHSEYVIALDGLPIIVHPSNPLTKMNKETVRKIFTGQITRWTQLGIRGGRINIYARDHNSGTYDTFKSLVLGKTPLIKNAKRFESNARLSDAVSSDPNGIGFVGMAYVRHAKVLAVSDTGTVAIKPTQFSVATEDYILSRRLFMYLPENNRYPLATEFVDFVVSALADKVVTEVGFVSQKISGYKIAVVHDAPEEYLQLIKGAERLSLNIRFTAGSIQLDNKAIRNIERLTAYLQKPKNKKRQLMLFGFADKHEVIPFISLSFSEQRADAVADYLLKQHVAPSKVRGYGQQLPVASNATLRGRYNNRRVEIWLM